MPAPLLPKNRKGDEAGSTYRSPFTNPFVPDASGRNGFQRAGEILRDTFTGVGRDAVSLGGLRPGVPTGAIGETTRTGLGFGFDMKSVIVYGIAFLFIFIGVSAMLRAPQVIYQGTRTGFREGVRRRAYRATRGED